MARSTTTLQSETDSAYNSLEILQLPPLRPLPMMSPMKALLTSAILIALAPAVAVADEARIAALEATVARLETQNLSLKAALEAVAGRSLAEILVAQTPAQTSTTPASAPTQAAPPAPDPARVAAAESIRRQIEAIQARHAAADKAARDPFRDKPRVGISKADQEKARAAELREIERLRAQLAALENP